MQPQITHPVPPPQALPQNPAVQHRRQIVNNRSGEHSVNKFMFIVPALLVLATIFLAGYFTNEYLKAKLPQAPALVSMPTLIPATPDPTPQAVAKNKTYFHPNLSFSFSYPENLALVDCGFDLYLFPAVSPESDSEALCGDPKGAIISLETSRSNLYQSVTTKEDVEEEFVVVSGYDAILQTVTQVGQTESIKHLSFEGPERYFLLSLTDPSYSKVFEELYKSMAFESIVTDNWRSYESSLGMSLKIPSDWQIIEEGNKVTIHKFEAKNLPNIVIEIQDQGELSPLSLINSTKNLPGWKTPPKVDMRAIDGEPAQAVKGQLNNDWYSFMAVWYGGKLMQIAYTDELSGDSEIVFEAILGTIKLQSGI